MVPYHIYFFFVAFCVLVFIAEAVYTCFYEEEDILNESLSNLHSVLFLISILIFSFMIICGICCISVDLLFDHSIWEILDEFSYLIPTLAVEYVYYKLLSCREWSDEYEQSEGQEWE